METALAGLDLVFLLLSGPRTKAWIVFSVQIRLYDAKFQCCVNIVDVSCNLKRLQRSNRFHTFSKNDQRNLYSVDCQGLHFWQQQ